MSDKIRMSGMVSGLDTESLITALTSNIKTKVDNAKNDQKKLSWTQDAWKDLNSKIYSLYSGKASSMRFSSSYTKRVTTSSNSALSVESGANAVDGTSSAKIISMAKSGYLTGGKITAEDGSALTNDSKVTDLGIAAGTKFTISSGENTKEIEITDTMTMYELTSAMKEVGVSANFDAVNKRIFIGASATGVANDFTLAATDEDGNEALSKLGLTAEAGAIRIEGADAELELNGARFTSTTNTFSINGSTYTINNMSDEDISLKTTLDTSSVYSSIESMLKDYNEAIKSMSESYYAESASKYTMLTDEQREALSEKEAEDWDNKIKSALLRKDSTLYSVMQSMKDAMSASIEIDGVSYSLSDFGITTAGYLNASQTERNTYHIAGNPNDDTSSSKADVLNKKISENPELVQKFFTQLAEKLYNAMGDSMKSTDYSSVYKVYNDKKMQTEYDNYTKKISDYEQKLSDAEDRYYKKYAAMEKALSKLNDTNSNLSSLFS